MRSNITIVGVLSLALGITGCGGGAGGSAAMPPAANGAAAAVPAGSSGASTAPAAANTPVLPGASVTTTANGRGLASTSSVPSIVQVVRAGNGGGNAIDVHFSNTVAPGNLLVAFIGTSDGSEGLIVQPSGWPPADRVSSGAGAGEASVAVFSRVATSSDVGATYHFWVQSPASNVALTAAIYEVSGATAISASAGGSSEVGWSATAPAINASGSALAISFLTQYVGGQQPIYFNGPNNWAGIYAPIFGAGYNAVSEAISSIVGSGTVAPTATWQNGHNGSQAAETILIGSSGTPAGPAAPTNPTPTNPAATPPPAPSAPQNGQRHVHSMLYYGGKFENSGVPASTLTQYADWVETAEDASFANNFINAGGTRAAVYTDPHFVPGCDYSGHCSGPMGNTQPESAWLHDAYGNRLRSSSGQNALNPASSAAQSAYNAYSHSLTDGSRWNAVIFDDSNPGYIASYWTYAMGAQPAEYANQSDPVAAWLSGEQGLAASASQPVIYNGGENDAADIAFLTSSNVLAHMIEGCVSFGMWRVDDSRGNPLHTWAPSLNKLLAATNRGKYAICNNYSVNNGDTVGDRLYGLASWWLTYDPTYSIAFPDYTTPDSYNGYSSNVFAEYQIVPTQPLQNPGSDVGNLKTSTGAYVREFAACYQNGNLIGRCAAVVNPNYASTFSMPSLSQSYSRHLNLDIHSAVNGGQATFTSGTPSSVGPTTGVILAQ